MSHQDECLKWIASQQSINETADFGANQTSVRESLQNQRERTATVRDYRNQINKLNGDATDLEEVEHAYANLSTVAEKRLTCLENLSDLQNLEDLFGNLTHEFSSKATSLAQKVRKEPVTMNGTHVDGLSPNTSQGCILALRNNWQWIAKLVKCSEIQLSHSAEYHQFFHTIEEYKHWMPQEIHKAEELLNYATLKSKFAQGDTAGKLLFEIKTAIAIFLNWQRKLDKVYQHSRTLVPVPLRTQKLDHQRPAVALCNYKTNQISLQEGEEVTVIDNSKIQSWLVKNLRAEESFVPSTILTIPGPDPSAVESALQMLLQFLAVWTTMIKRYGKTIILFLLHVIRVWTNEEEKMLKALADVDKKDILHLLDSIEKTFSPYWDQYPPYQTLKSRMENTREILKLSNSSNQNENDPGSLLVVQTAILEDLLARYRDFWSQWETFKVLTETTRHPEYLLTVSDWDQYKFLDPAEWLKKWQTTLDFDESDYDEFGRTSPTEEERHMVEQAKETAETSQLTTCEQEERQTFVITGVVDPTTGNEISLDKAVSMGIINQAEGKYVNPRTRESMPIPVAMNAGKIKVEIVTTKKSEEKKRDIGIITIKVVKESRPYTIKGVIDAKTEKQMTVDEATRAGILDQRRGIYKNSNTDEELNLGDALASGLLVVEYQTDNEASEPEVETKTYAVHAVINLKTKARVSFSEAIRSGLINPDDGAYYNNVADENVYIGDAIKKGYVKASVVHDPKLIDIAPGNRIMVDENKMQNFRQKVMQPLKAMNALKRSVQPEVNGAKNGVNGK